MAITSEVEHRTRLKSFRDAPAIPRDGRTRKQRSRAQRIVRRVILALAGMVAVFTLGFATAAPANASLTNPLEGVENTINGFCGPKNVTVQIRGTGFEAFFAPPHSDKAKTVLYGMTEGKREGGATDDMANKPSYERYGIAPLIWQPWGNAPGCFRPERWFNEIPNDIFNASKLFGMLSMALIGWSFGTPFSFLNGPINGLSSGIANVSKEFLGVVGVAGALYLAFKNWGPNGRLTAVLKGIGWMGLITSLLFWFTQGNATRVADMIDKQVGTVAQVGFSALTDLPNSGNLCKAGEGDVHTDAMKKANDDGGHSDAALCIQNALWQPLLYYPWVYGEVGKSDKPSPPGTNGWAPLVLNAQYVGVNQDGKIDADGAKTLDAIKRWNSKEDYGDDSKNTSDAWPDGGDHEVGTDPVHRTGREDDPDRANKIRKYNDGFVADVPMIYLWGDQLCDEDDGGTKNLGDCWNDKTNMPQAYTPVANEIGGQDLTGRMTAAVMSVAAGVIINSAIYFICAMLLATKLGVYVLLVFAPLYLLMGIFPGPSRVAAIKIGEMLLANFFKQVGWTLALVILTYMYTVILNPSSDQNWILKILTCALLTVLFVAYAKPFVRAISGMAMGDKEAGGAIEGVGSDLAKKTGQLAVQAGMAVATGGASAVGAAASIKGAQESAAASGTSLSGMDKLKAGLKGVEKVNGPMGGGFGRKLSRLSGAGAAGKRSFEETERKREDKEEAAAIKSTPGAAEGIRRGRGERITGRARDAALEEIRARREAGDEQGAVALEAQLAAAMPDQRTGAATQKSRLASHAQMMGRLEENGTVVSKTGEQVMADLGHRNNQEAAAQVMTVVRGVDIAKLDPTAPATAAIREARVADMENRLSPQHVRNATDAVAQYGVPNQVETVARPVSAGPPQMHPVQMAHQLSLQVQQMPQNPTTTDRVHLLQTVDQLARETPANTAMSTALNDLRAVLPNDQMDIERVNVAIGEVFTAANYQPNQPI